MQAEHERRIHHANATPCSWIFHAAVSASFIRGSQSGGFPKVLERLPVAVQSRCVAVDGYEIHVSSDPRLAGLKSPVGFHLVTRVQKCMGHDVIEKVALAMEAVVDSVALMSSARCRMGGLNAWRVEDWPRPGDILLGHMVPSQILPCVRSTPTEVTLPSSPTFVLPPDLGALGKRVRAAMRWFSKGMNAASDVDAFSFFWIAAEVLNKLLRPDLAKSPIRVSCGHFIRECPECQKSVMKTPNGEIMRSILEDAGVSEEMARQLWKTRQMFHGQNHLTHDAIKRLPDEVSELRRAVQKMISDLYSAAVGPTDCLSPPNNIPGTMGLLLETEIGAELLEAWEALGLRD